MPVGRQDLVKQVAARTNKSAKETTEMVNATLDAIKEVLETGEAVRLVGFGGFSVQEVGPSVRVNPRTREKINVPARKRVKFTAGTGLNQAISGGGA